MLWFSLYRPSLLCFPKPLTPPAAAGSGLRFFHVSEPSPKIQMLLSVPGQGTAGLELPKLLPGVVQFLPLLHHYPKTVQTHQEKKKTKLRCEV